MQQITDRTPAMRLILWIMCIFGIWSWGPAKKDESTILVFFKRNHRYLIHFPLTFTFIGLMWLEAFVSSNLEQAGQVLYMSITEAALIVKVLNIWYRREAAWQLLHHLQHYSEFELQSEEEQKYWRREQKSFKLYFYVYILISLGVVGSSCIGVLILKDFELPFAYFVPFEWRNERRYWYAYGYCTASMTVNCISNITLDTLGCYFMFHVSLLYRLLAMRLKSLNGANNEQQFQDELRKMFKLHHRIRRITLECQTLVSPYILSQIILSAFIICFSGYRLQHVGILANPGQFLSMIQFVSVMILQIFLPCYYGNQITFCANQLTNEVYHINWLQCKQSSRKLLYTYMEHLKQPVRIQAGYFFAVGLPIFVKTINNAYSFFALLLNVSK